MSISDVAGESATARLQASAMRAVKQDEELDFSKEPIFTDTSEPVRRDIPGLEGSYLLIKPNVDYAVEQGRNKYGYQEQQIEVGPDGKRKPSDTVRSSYDLYGLFVYKAMNCLLEICLIDPKTGRERKASRAGTIRDLITTIKSRKLCEWIEGQINEVMGWTEEDEATKDTFPGAAEGAGEGESSSS